MDSVPTRREKWACFIFRLALGFALVWSGFANLAVPQAPPTDLEAHTVNVFSWFELIYPYYLSIAELVLGVAIIVGFLTRIFAVITALLFLFYTFLEATTVPWGLFSSAWVHFAFFLLALAMIFHGAPYWSLDALLKRQ